MDSEEVMPALVTRPGVDAPEDPGGTQPCWGTGRAMQPVMEMVERVADSDVTVLLRGESGVGKEIIARELHRRSSRRARPLVKVNCAALPAELLESELFGHERGAFTGAGTSRVGRFECAQRGTLLLDEIGEMPVALQVKLLHVLQDRSFTRLGSNHSIDVDVRVIAATSRDLETMLQAGTFREDLYYRLDVIELRIPPLRERCDEIPALIEFFLAKFARAYRRPTVRPSAVLMEVLSGHGWPGNIRELENMIKRLVVLQDESLILADVSRLRQSATAIRPSATTPLSKGHSGTAVSPAMATDIRPAREVLTSTGPDDQSAEGIDLQALARGAALEAERAAIDYALARCRWNRRKAAVFLKVSYKTLLNKMKECGISQSGTASGRP